VKEFMLAVPRRPDSGRQSVRGVGHKSSQSESHDKVESGTDTLPFSMPVCPGINMNQETDQYNYTHHSAADRSRLRSHSSGKNLTLMA